MNDGGPAFPTTLQADKSQITVDAGCGMTLRDYFAAKALAGQVAYEGAEGCGNDAGANDVAKWCYAIADAMLAERLAVTK